LLNKFQKFKFQNNSFLFSDCDFSNFVFKAQSTVHVVVLFSGTVTERQGVLREKRWQWRAGDSHRRCHV